MVRSSEWDQCNCCFIIIICIVGCCRIIACTFHDVVQVFCRERCHDVTSRKKTLICSKSFLGDGSLVRLHKSYCFYVCDTGILLFIFSTLILYEVFCPFIIS